MKLISFLSPAASLYKGEVEPDYPRFFYLTRINEHYATIDPSYEKKEAQLVTHILGKLPKEYSEVVTKCSGTTTAISQDDVEMEIKSFWKRALKKAKLRQLTSMS